MKNTTVRRKMSQLRAWFGSLSSILGKETASGNGTRDHSEWAAEIDALMGHALQQDSWNGVLRCLMETAELCDRMTADPGLGGMQGLQSIRIHIDSVPNLYLDLPQEEQVKEAKRDLLDAICGVRGILETKTPPESMGHGSI